MLTNVLIVLLVDPMITTSDIAVRKVALSEDEDLEELPEEFKEHATCVSIPCPAIPPLSRLVEQSNLFYQRKSKSKLSHATTSQFRCAVINPK